MGILIFYLVGTIVVIFHSYLNDTILLQHNLFGKEITGDIVSISTNENHKNTILLKDVTVKNYKNLQLKRVIVYTNESIFQDLNQKKLLQSQITFFGNLYASNPPLSPYGFNFKLNDYFNHISAKGYIKKIITIKTDNNTSSNPNKISFYYQSFQLQVSKIHNFLSNTITQFSSNSDSANIIKAVLLGDKLTLNQKLKDNLSKSSLMHIITISGYHISFITLIIFFAIRKSIAIIPRINIYFNSQIIAAIFTIPIIFCYITLIGDKIPALRAYLMVVFLLIGLIFNKQILSINNLFLVITVLLLFNPHYIYSLSFLLSVIATLSLFIIYSNSYFINFQKNYFQSKLGIVVRFFITIFLVSLFINFLINPLISHYFNFIPLLGFLANILVIPLFSFFIMPSLIAFILLILPFKTFAIFLLGISNLGISIMLKLSDFFANFSLSYVEGNNLSYPGFFFYFSGLVCLVLLQRFYKLIGIFFILITYFLIFTTQKPDIIISQDFKIAILLNNNYIIYNKGDTNKNQILKFLNIKNISNIKFNEISKCDDMGCLINIKNKNITIQKNSFLIVDDCKNAHLIIAYKQSIKTTCYNQTQVIDRNYLRENGSIYILLNETNNNLKIISNKLPLKKPWNKYFNN
jgi:competence protein ComEC